MKLLAVNGSPRKTWNTAQVLERVALGAARAGAKTETIHLRDLQFKGCISCFNCKLKGGPSYGRCAIQDDLSELLQKAREADVIVLGSPVYFAAESSLMRCCMERLLFQYPVYSGRPEALAPKKATALVYTMNSPEGGYGGMDMQALLKVSQHAMSRVFGSCELFICAETLQFRDYSPYDAAIFDGAARQKRHEEVFPQELAKAEELGARLVV